MTTQEILDKIKSCECDLGEEENQPVLDFLISLREKLPTLENYTPTEEEYTLLKELLNITDSWYWDGLTIKMFEPGFLSVRTSPTTWLGLMGREWVIDIDRKMKVLICLN